MNFNKILLMQKALDENIASTHNIKQEEVIKHKIVALIVEIAEFANEIQVFKYWKRNKNIDNKLVLEEFVDGIHFFLSLVITIDADTIIEPIIVSDNKVEQLAAVFDETSKLNHLLTKEQVKKSFGLYIGMAKLIGLNSDEIEKYYIEKNKVNFERLANGY